MPKWWHRIYASHPDSETRQQKLAASIAPESPAAGPQSEFLARLDGLEFGSAKNQGVPFGRKRYFMQWRLALEVPDGWVARMDTTAEQLWLWRRDGVRMQIERTSDVRTDAPCDWLAALEAPNPATDTQPLHEGDPLSCTGIVRKSFAGLFGRREQVFRAGVMATGRDAEQGFVFRGHARAASFAESDASILAVARSMETIGASDESPGAPVLRIRRAAVGESFAALAQNSPKIPGDAEGVLRLLNRRYPSGELVVGELIKVIE
jgi:predicted Zn-dependent protease